MVPLLLPARSPFSSTLPSALPSADSPVVAGLSAGIITVVIIFLLIVIVGFTLIVRRRHRGAPVEVTGSAPDPAEQATRSGALLVQLDDAVARADEELGFAIAQFGDDRSAVFATAITAAKQKLTESFRLRQQLDDTQPDSASQRREWTARIIHLCESSIASLERETAEFDALRRRETDAPAEVKAVRMLVVATSMRIPATDSALSALARSHPAAAAPVASNVTEARALLVTAAAQAGEADAGIADGASAVGDTLQLAQSTVQRAVKLLDQVDELSASLAAESARLSELTTRTTADLAEARTARDDAPDPDSGAAIGTAIAGVESVLAASDPTDPSGSIARIQAAVAGLDTALAGARNQAQRLEHATAALAGTLVSARSQIEATSDFIAAKRGGIGADARTRLAEARRLLTVAEALSDPVEALDAARSSATYSRDADALARYDARG